MLSGEAGAQLFPILSYQLIQKLWLVLHKSLPMLAWVGVQTVHTFRGTVEPSYFDSTKSVH